MIQEDEQTTPPKPINPGVTGFRFGVFELDVTADELRKEGRLIRIRNQPLRILALLLQNPGVVVTREQVRRELWHADELVDFDQGLNHGIREIRAVLGDHPDSPRFIQTLPRRGYRFLAEVRPLRSHGTPLESAPPFSTAPAEVTTESRPHEPPPEAPNAPSSASVQPDKRRAVLSIMGAVVVIVLAVVTALSRGGAPLIGGPVA